MDEFKKLEMLWSDDEEEKQKIRKTKQIIEQLQNVNERHTARQQIFVQYAKNPSDSSRQNITKRLSDFLENIKTNPSLQLQYYSFAADGSLTEKPALFSYTEEKFTNKVLLTGEAAKIFREKLHRSAEKSPEVVRQILLEIRQDPRMQGLFTNIQTPEAQKAAVLALKQEELRQTLQSKISKAVPQKEILGYYENKRNLLRHIQQSVLQERHTGTGPTLETPEEMRARWQEAIQAYLFQKAKSRVDTMYQIKSENRLNTLTQDSQSKFQRWMDIFRGNVAAFHHVALRQQPAQPQPAQQQPPAAQQQPGMRLAESIRAVVDAYASKDVKQYLTEPRGKSFTYDEKLPITRGIQNIINNALRGLDSKAALTDKRLTAGEKFIFSDVHGRLDMLLQELYAAGLINNQGEWIGGHKKALQLGDLINRGPYSMETLVYVMALKKQAEKAGGEFTVLMGNHEHCIMNGIRINFSNIQNETIMKEMLIHHVLQGQIQLAHGDNQNYFLSTHAGLEKGLLIKAILRINPKTKAELDQAKRNDGSIPGNQIMQIMEKYQITVEEIAKHLNETLVKNLREALANKDMSNFANSAYLVEGKRSHGTWNLKAGQTFYKGLQSEGVINTRKKPRQSQKGKGHDPMKSSRSQKFDQIVGHVTTVNHFKYNPNTQKHENTNNIPRAQDYGAIKRINSRIFTDFDMLRGNRAFTVIQNKELFQVKCSDKGLETTHAASGAIMAHLAQKVPRLARFANPANEPYGSYHGNTKQLDMKGWEIKSIKTMGRTWRTHRQYKTNAQAAFSPNQTEQKACANKAIGRTNVF